MALNQVQHDDPMYRLLRDGSIKEFNRGNLQGEFCDPTYCDLRNLDLRALDAIGIDFSNSYFRSADLRRIGFSAGRLEGASLNDFKISRADFPADLTPDEIVLSVNRGTRMRHRK